MKLLTIPLPYKSQAKNRRSDALMTVNVQRNLHYNAAANFKRNYGILCRQAVEEAKLTPMGHVAITYTIHTKPTKGSPTVKEPYRGSLPKQIDLLNVGAVIDKVMSDVLVDMGIIPDDSIRHVQRLTFHTDPWADSEFVTVAITAIKPIKDPRRSDEDN